MAERVEIERTTLGQQSFDRWAADARLVEEEAQAQTDAQKHFLAVEDALTEWDAYLHSLPLDQHEMAVNGLREYLMELTQERDITMGRVHDET